MVKVMGTHQLELLLLGEAADVLGQLLRLHGTLRKME